MTLERRRAAKQRRKSREEMPDRPWGSMRNGKGITESWLADQLQPFGIRPHTMRIGSMQAKGYFVEDFREPFQRYISRADMEALKAELAATQPPGRSGATPRAKARSGASALRAKRSQRK